MTGQLDTISVSRDLPRGGAGSRRAAWIGGIALVLLLGGGATVLPGLVPGWLHAATTCALNSSLCLRRRRPTTVTCSSIVFTSPRRS